MTAFDRYYKREKLISKKLDIEEELYNELERLSKDIYDASINKLVNSAIEELILTEKIELYNMKNKNYVSRSFLIRQSFSEGLYELKQKYKISVNLLVNIAIKNVITNVEKENKNKIPTVK